MSAFAQRHRLRRRKAIFFSPDQIHPYAYPDTFPSPGAESSLTSSGFDKRVRPEAQFRPPLVRAANATRRNYQSFHSGEIDCVRNLQ